MQKAVRNLRHSLQSCTALPGFSLVLCEPSRKQDQYDKQSHLDIYVFGSGVQDRVLCNANGGHVVYKDGNPTETQTIILQGLFHPKYLGAIASSGNILSFCGRKRYASLLARGPRHQRCIEKLTSAGCRLAIQPTPTKTREESVEYQRPNSGVNFR